MGEFDLPSTEKELEESINAIEKEWFFAGENYLWNSAIKKNLPSLERLIDHKNAFFAHRLKFG